MELAGKLLGAADGGAFDEGLRGEVVMLLDRPAPLRAGADAVEAALAARRGRMSLKDAAREVAAGPRLASRNACALRTAVVGIVVRIIAPDVEPSDALAHSRRCPGSG